MKDKILYNVAVGKDLECTQYEEDFISNRIYPSFIKVNSNEKNSWESYILKVNKRIAELDNIIKQFKENEISFLKLKGLAMYKYYPKDTPRQSYDFDLIVKNINHFWNCHKILINNGYTFTYFPMMTKYKEKIVGVTKYQKKIDNETDIFIEINIGSYIISEITWFDDKDLWENTQEFEYKGLKLNVPSDEINLVILIIEASGRDNFFIRDLVDFHFMVNSSAIDWEYVKNKLGNKYLIGILNKFKQNYDIILQSRDNVLLNLKNNKINMEFQYIIPNISLNRKPFKMFYYKYLRLLGEKKIAMDRWVKLVNTLEQSISSRENFDIGLLINLYQLNNNSNDLQWIKYKKYDLLNTPIGTFWGTKFAILGEEEEILMKRFLEEDKHEKY